MANKNDRHCGWVQLIRPICPCQSSTKIKDNRKNWDKSALEETLSMAQLLTSLMVEIQNQHAVHKDLLLEKVIHPFLDFDPNFELELQSALSECKADFQPADISKFKDVVAVVSLIEIQNDSNWPRTTNHSRRAGKASVRGHACISRT